MGKQQEYEDRLQTIEQMLEKVNENIEKSKNNSVDSEISKTNNSDYFYNNSLLGKLRAAKAYQKRIFKKNGYEYFPKLNDFSINDLMFLLNLQGYKCFYCKEPFTQNNFWITRIIPASQEGLFILENIVLMCEKCNKSFNNLVDCPSVGCLHCLTQNRNLENKDCSAR